MTDTVEYDRRSDVDSKFSEIESAIVGLKAEMAVNTVITAQVRDLLASFRVMAAVAKWLTAIGAFGLMCWQAWLRFTGR